MNFFKKLLSPHEGPYFRSTVKDLASFGKNEGRAVFGQDYIKLNNYPHPASNYSKNGIIQAADISQVYLEGCHLSIQLGPEIIFLLRDLQSDLRVFALRNKIPVAIRNSNWSFITEPFLDTEFTVEQKEESINLLISRGFSELEIARLRTLIEKQMMKYNFDTMLNQWQELDLHDVLLAMKPRMSKEDFKTFYWKAMEIELRAR